MFGTWHVETRDFLETVPGSTHLKDGSGGRKLMRQSSLNVEHSVRAYLHDIRAHSIFWSG